MTWPTRKAVEGPQKFQDSLQNSDHTDLISGARAEVGRPWPDSQDQESTKGARRARQGWVTGNRTITNRVTPSDELHFASEFAMLLRGIKEGAGPGSPGEREVESCEKSSSVAAPRRVCCVLPSQPVPRTPHSPAEFRGHGALSPDFLTCLVSERSLVAPVNISRPCCWVLPTADPPDSGEPSCPSTRCR